MSTDYVFDGLSIFPYNENNNTNPKNYYGKTKLAGENKILNQKLENSAIIRTSWLYSNLENNFVNKIIKKLNNQKKIYVVEDEIGSPTNAYDLSKVIMDIIPKLSNSNTEIYHFSNLGFCSRYQFANKINQLLNANCEIISDTNKFSKIKRPNFSALDSSKIIKNFKLKINPWEISLKNPLEKNFTNLFMEFRCKNLLVTGGAGFIGSNFIKVLLDKYRNIKVVNLDALTYAGNIKNTKHFVRGNIYNSITFR